MSFELDQMTEVLGCWFLAWADKDWMGIAWRANPLVGWTFRWRVRYYAPEDPDPWSGLDRRAWYEATTEAAMTREAVIAQTRQLVAQLRERWPQPTTLVDEVLVEGDGMALMRALAGRPWVHHKSGDEAQAWQEAFDAKRLPAQITRATRLKRPGRKRR